MVDLVEARVRIHEIGISDGSTIRLGDNDALIIVGPNNSGKSRLLVDIEEYFKLNYDSVYDGRVAKGITISSDSAEDITQALAPLQEQASEYYSSYGVRVHQNYIHNAFQGAREVVRFGNTFPFFMKRISSDDRLSIVAPSPPLGENGPETPAQVLYDSEALLNQVSGVFKRAFNRDLFLNYRSGGTIPIYTGVRPAVPAGLDRVSDEYVQLVRACDKLHEQGDGMKSFGGILLSTLVVKYNITLIDEPEAFLHPPQERIIGRIIAEEASGQVFCSTHSKDVLQGFLESKRKDIRVIRIVRDDDVNFASEISPAEIEELWRDPVFRYSTALDALFHDRTVLCEADPDCRFFEAIEREIFPDSPLDSHYVPCGGKAAFPKFIKALRKLSIPVLAILDLDVLNDEKTIKGIYEAQGGDWAKISPLWRRLDKAVRDGVVVDSLEVTKQKLADLIGGWEGDSPPLSDMLETIKQKKPWGKVKELGVTAIPSGDAQKFAEELLDELASYDVYPIPVGTLEKFVRSVGNHGIKWLNEVFATYDLRSEKLKEAREFVSRVLG